MYGTSRHQYDRYNSGPLGSGPAGPTQRDPAKTAPVCEVDVTAGTSPDILGLDPIRIRGDPKPATYLQVNSDGTVSSKIIRPVSRDTSSSKVFSRFAGRSSKPEAGTAEPAGTKGPSGTTPTKETEVPAGTILSSMILNPPLTSTSDPLWDQKADTVPDPSLSPARSTTPLVRTFTPFFNNNLFITKDCRSELTGNSLSLVVELAGILSVPPKIYPFGNAIDLTYPNQPISLQFLGESQEGTATGRLLNENGTIIILLDTYSNSTGASMTFEEIDLPVTMTFKGTLLTI